jgi:hypothetical protein
LNLSFINNNIFFLEDVVLTKENLFTTRKILIIWKHSEALNNDLLAFLKKILAAIHCDPEKDVWFFSVENDHRYSVSQIKNQLPSENAILFGFTPEQFGVRAQIKKYSLTTIGGVGYLFCDQLSDIEQHTPLKAALWEALKTIVR